MSKLIRASNSAGDNATVKITEAEAKSMKLHIKISDLQKKL